MKVIRCHLPGNLISQLLARYDGHFLAYSLVGMKVKGQTSVVLLNENFGCLLDRLGSYTSLVGGNKNRLVVSIQSDTNPLPFSTGA